MRHRLEYWLVALVAFAIRRLPWRVVSAAGEWLGLAFYGLGARRRGIALDNLARALPDREPVERARIARLPGRRADCLLDPRPAVAKVTDDHPLIAIRRRAPIELVGVRQPPRIHPVSIRCPTGERIRPAEINCALITEWVGLKATVNDESRTAGIDRPREHSLA